MEKAFLISINTLKKNYLIDENVEDGYLFPMITKCQDFIIEKLVKKDLYNTLISEVLRGQVSEQNAIIIKEYIQPIIGWYVCSELFYATAYKLKNSGEDVETSKYKEVILIANKYLKDSEAYQSRLKEYFNDNSIIANKTLDTYKTGFYLGHS